MTDLSYPQASEPKQDLLSNKRNLWDNYFSIRKQITNNINTNENSVFYNLTKHSIKFQELLIYSYICEQMQNPSQIIDKNFLINITDDHTILKLIHCLYDFDLLSLNKKLQMFNDSKIKKNNQYEVYYQKLVNFYYDNITLKQTINLNEKEEFIKTIQLIINGKNYENSLNYIRDIIMTYRKYCLNELKFQNLEFEDINSILYLSKKDATIIAEMISYIIKKETQINNENIENISKLK